MFFLLGSVIDQDTEAAYRWFLAAAEGHHRDAQALVERLAPFYGNAIEPGNKPKQLPDWQDWLAAVMRVAIAVFDRTEDAVRLLKRAFLACLTAQAAWTRGAAGAVAERTTRSLN